jgi:cystathionine beta-lyase/cystathionine gamma-synthase
VVEDVIVKLQMGIKPRMIRISAGLEDVSDLVADLDAALAG